MARHEPLALVIFDCDGVLVDSEPIASRTMAEHLTALGYPMTPEQCVERFTGVSLKTVMSRIEADWGRSLPEDFVPSLRERDFAAFAADLKSIEGVAEAVAELAVPVCVASSGAMAKMRFTLGVTGLLPLFEPHLFTAEDVPLGKPAPDLFLHAARHMGVAASASVVVVDSVAGIQAARAAGMRVFGFVGGGHAGPGYADALRDAGADVVFDRMKRLSALVRDPSSETFEKT